MWLSAEKSGRPNALPGIGPHSRPSHFQAWSVAQAQGSQLMPEAHVGLSAPQGLLTVGLFSMRHPGNLGLELPTRHRPLGTGPVGLGPLLALNVF